MCEACAGQRPGTTRREKVWELDPVWHCLVIGTCLTLADLRGLARKLGYRLDHSKVRDYELHSHFVGEAGRPTRAGKQLNKLLDRRHAASIRRFAAAKNQEELLALWQETFNAGDIPGPLWAAASHPALVPDVATRIYGDVHMLSHLVGAANRADIHALRRLEEENTALTEKLARETRRHLKRATETEQSLSQLSERLAKAERAQERADRLEAELAELKNGHADAVPRQLQIRLPEDSGVAALRAELSERDEEMRRLTSELDAAGQREAALRVECEALERLLNEDLDEDAGAPSGAHCPFDLDGRCILYVGGRAAIVCRLRALVQQWNGEFLHHDGGLEKSIGELASAVTRADAVVFPTDCVSHSAVNKLKRLCQRNMKPFVPLRSAGLSSFVAGLQDGIGGL